MDIIYIGTELNAWLAETLCTSVSECHRNYRDSVLMIITSQMNSTRLLNT